MKIAICVVAVTALVGMCSKSDNVKYVAISDQLIEYQLEGDQYAVVVVQDGMGASEAKKMARQRAAEITVQVGGRYFTVDSEETTQVMRSDQDQIGTGNQGFYGNMYQELIIEGDFGKSSMERQQYQMAPVVRYDATRLVFTIYSQKPRGKSAIDACTLTECNK